MANPVPEVAEGEPLEPRAAAEAAFEAVRRTVLGWGENAPSYRHPSAPERRPEDPAAREVMIEGPSGVRALPRYGLGGRPRWEASRRRLVWPNGLWG